MLGENTVFIRCLIASFITLGLLVPMAGAKTRKAHPAGSHPKPAKHVAALRPRKVKPHKAE
jgi:hypothetical protein